MTLEDKLVYGDVEIKKGDKIKLFKDNEEHIGYFVGYRDDRLVYISSKKDGEWESAYNIEFYKLKKID